MARDILSRQTINAIEHELRANADAIQRMIDNPPPIITREFVLDLLPKVNAIAELSNALARHILRLLGEL